MHYLQNDYKLIRVLYIANYCPLHPACSFFDFSSTAVILFLSAILTLLSVFPGKHFLPYPTQIVKTITCITLEELNKCTL